MKKILLAFDGIHFSDAAFDFVNKLNALNPILLTGVFLPQISYANLWSYADGMSTPNFLPLLEDDDMEVIEKNVKKFEALCVKNHIEYRTHKDLNDLALPELKKESRFADLLIIGEEKFYENMGSGNPNNYLKETLQNIECPVIVVPEKYTFPSINIIAYDGSESSVFAIKQFVYLLPELAKNPTLLTYANQDENSLIPNEKYIEELVSRHFTDLTVSKLDIDSRKYFSTWIADRKSSILIAGSFGRTSFSQFFKKSFLMEVISEHQLPIFICHK